MLSILYIFLLKIFLKAERLNHIDQILKSFEQRLDEQEKQIALLTNQNQTQKDDDDDDDIFNRLSRRSNESNQ